MRNLGTKYGWTRGSPSLDGEPLGWIYTMSGHFLRYSKQKSITENYVCDLYSSGPNKHVHTHI